METSGAQSLTHGIWLGVVAAVLAMLARSFALMVVAGVRTANDHPVVVGDPNASGMPEVQAQPLQAIQPGGWFGELATGGIVFSAIAATIARAITGPLIVGTER